MKRTRRRKCKSCKRLFTADRRNAWHQRHCGESPCRLLSKRAAQRRWSCKPENRSYFCGAAALERTRQWRIRHPGYSKKAPLQDVILPQPTETTKESGSYNLSCAASKKPLQELIGGECVGKIEESGKYKLSSPAKPLALQDIVLCQEAVLIGLIATLSGATLQDDIASFSNRLILMGQDILRGGNDGEKRIDLPRVSAQSAGGEL